MGDQLISTKIKMSVDGQDAAVKGFADLNEQARQTAERIQQADAAARSLNTSVADMAPLNTSGGDFWSSSNQSQMNTKIKETAEQIKKVSQATYDFGQAGEQATSMLDSLAPGLGGIAEAAMSLNPAALLATTAIVGLSLAVGEVQKQAEAARAAGEAMALAESDRVLAAINLADRTNLALEGDKSARQKILTDLAQYTAAKDSLERQGAENAKNIAEQLKIINDLDNDTSQAATLQETKRRIEARRQAQGALDGFEETSAKLASQMENVDSQFKLLTASAQELKITSAEQAAINKAATTGFDGAAAALQKVWSAGEGFAKFGENVENVLDKFKDFGSDAVKFAESQRKKAAEDAKALAETQARLADTTAKLIDLNSEWNQTLADRATAEQRTAQMSQLNDKLAAAIQYDQSLAKNRKIAEIQQEGQNAEIQAQARFMENSQKLLANYIKSEEQATSDHNTARIRKLQDLYASLQELSSARDVSGFVNARRSGMTDIERSDTDFGTAAQRRKANYEQQQSDLVAASNKENAARQQQLQQRLQQEQQAGQQQISMADRVRKEIATLEAQWAKKDLFDRQQREQEAFNRTRAILMQKQATELKLAAQTAGGIVDIAIKARDSVLKTANSILGFPQGGSVPLARGVPKFHEGTPFLTHGGLAVLKAGESVLNPAETAQRLRGGNSGGSPATLVIQNLNVGKVATQADIDHAVGVVVGAIQSFGANGNS